MIKSYFDENEMFSAFEQLGKNNQLLQLELRIEPEKNYDFTIWRSNDKEKIELKKSELKSIALVCRV